MPARPKTLPAIATNPAPDGGSGGAPLPAGLHQKAYQMLRRAVMSGRFRPGEKLSMRQIAKATNIGLTPVREALVRLIGEGALETTYQRSARIPVMSKARILEIMQLRMMLEGHAAERAAAQITAEEIEQLQIISLEILAARQRQDVSLDILKIYEFHFALYRAARSRDLLMLIESLWLRTGPYLNLLFPDYTKHRYGEGRGRIIAALSKRDGKSARKEVEIDIRDALTYVAETFAPP